MQPRTFPWVEIAFSAGIINMLINAPLGWALVLPNGVLPVWGVPGVALDLVTTAFGTAVGTVAVATPQIRRRVAMGKLLPPSLSPSLRYRLKRLPHGALQRAILMGVITVLLTTPLPLIILALLDSQGLDRLTFTVLKGSFAFVVGALITPVVAAAATIKKSHRAEERQGCEF